MKSSRSKWTIAVVGFFAILSNARAADPVQTVTLKVPVEIDWPQADVNQAFLQGPPFLKCYLAGGQAPSDPTSMQWFALAATPDNQFIATASQPLMVDASGHFSGTVSVTFSASAAAIGKANGLSYFCYLASSNKKNAYLRDFATGRGLKTDVEQSFAWKTIPK